jgi:hypothetical protein
MAGTAGGWAKRFVVAVVVSCVLGAPLPAAADVTAADTTTAASGMPTAATGRPIPPIASPPVDDHPTLPPGASFERVPTVASPPPATVARPAPRARTGFVEGRSAEVVDQRNEFGTTFDNFDGTHTTKISLTPRNFRKDGAWVPVDDTIVPDTARPGSLHNKAGAFDVQFAPLPTGVVVRTDEGTFTMAPKDAAPVRPSPTRLAPRRPTRARGPASTSAIA